MFGLFLVTFVPNVVGEFIALEPTDYKHHFLEGWPGPWQNGSGGVDGLDVNCYYCRVEAYVVFIQINLTYKIII